MTSSDEPRKVDNITAQVDDVHVYEFDSIKMSLNRKAWVYIMGFSSIPLAPQQNLRNFYQRWSHFLLYFMFQNYCKFHYWHLFSFFRKNVIYFSLYTRFRYLSYMDKIIIDNGTRGLIFDLSLQLYRYFMCAYK